MVGHEKAAAVSHKVRERGGDGWRRTGAVQVKTPRGGLVSGGRQVTAAIKVGEADDNLTRAARTAPAPQPDRRAYLREQEEQLLEEGTTKDDGPYCGA